MRLFMKDSDVVQSIGWMFLVKVKVTLKDNLRSYVVQYNLTGWWAIHCFG